MEQREINLQILSILKLLAMAANAGPQGNGELADEIVLLDGSIQQGAAEDERDYLHG